MPERSIEEVLEEHTPALMAIPGVVGTAVGLCEGRRCIRVLVVEPTPRLREAVPRSLGGYPVRVEAAGRIRPLDPDTQGR